MKAYLKQFIWIAASAFFMIGIAAENALSQVTSGWTWNHPSPTSNRINDIFAVDDNTVVAIGGSGIFWSGNNGSTWDHVYNAEFDLQKIHFADQNHGWAVGDSGTILHSSDGGKSWNPQSGCTSISLLTVYFSNPSVGWAAGAGGFVCHTTNGGETWAERNTHVTIVITGIQFLNENTGFLVGLTGVNRIFQRTTDGGQNWENGGGFGNGNYFDLHFTDADNGWITGDIGRVLRTTDGGTSWEQALNLGNVMVNRVHFQNQNVGYIAYGNRITRTEDGGQTWSDVLNVSPAILNGLHVAGNGRVWTSGTVGLVMSSEDAGITWTDKSSRATSERISNIHFFDSQNGYANHVSGLLKTTNGGRNWESIETGFAPINSAHFTAENLIWIVGNNGNIRKSVNGGEDWTAHNFPENKGLTSVHFLDAQTGWAGVFAGGEIIRTTNGGESWQSAVTGTSILFDIHFVNSQTGFAGGIASNSAAIARTTDGGQTWETTSIPGSGEVRKIYFFDQNNGWAVGTNGVMSRTTNGGASWSQKTMPLTIALNDVFFIDQNHGWITGVNGTIFATADGGENWVVQPSVTGNMLFSVFFLDEENGWAGGDNGTILKYGPMDAPVNILPEPETPVQAVLHPNYPNPFNPYTNIRFILHEQSLVRLTIYDVLGRQVITLANGNFTAGEHTLPFDASGLGSGVYLYRLDVNGRSMTRKMTLLK